MQLTHAATCFFSTSRLDKSCRSSIGIQGASPSDDLVIAIKSSIWPLVEHAFLSATGSRFSDECSGNKEVKRDAVDSTFTKFFSSLCDHPLTSDSLSDPILCWSHCDGTEDHTIKWLAKRNCKFRETSTLSSPQYSTMCQRESHKYSQLNRTLLS
ncbi:hypothetical protein CEXT_20031 [Caerostris extrusa]|uniref:Uncharacterized protein n=1 Tax=Caerostris extrusa TaxID=172846 RepID=A0AAV4PYQ4_CAEEX|nr:hypothetical protein CEXT_20031 [Caerostris extrusa]